MVLSYYFTVRLIKFRPLIHCRLVSTAVFNQLFALLVLLENRKV